MQDGLHSDLARLNHRFIGHGMGTGIGNRGNRTLTAPPLAAASTPQRMDVASVDHPRCRARNTTSENMTGLPAARRGLKR